MSTETLEEAQAVLSYPMGIDQVPYASFMKIMRYEYQEGLAKVAANQNDALGSFARSGAMSTLVNGVTGAMSGVYGGVDGGDADQWISAHRCLGVRRWSCGAPIAGASAGAQRLD